MGPAQLKHCVSGSTMSQRPPPSLFAQTMCSHTAPRRYTSAAFDTESTLMSSRMLTELEPRDRRARCSRTSVTTTVESRWQT
jgi:hypothetical protein